jgi:ferritin-like metal-binding protein YciE
MKTSETLPTLLSLLDYDAGKFTSAEAQLQNTLPRWIEDAGSLQLKCVLEKYLALVQEHIKKLDIFCAEENFTYISLRNRVMTAFIEETDEKLALCGDAQVIDACLLACVQNINHYKISTYGTAAAFARDLAMNDAVTIFRDLEIDEKQIDHRLSQLAEHEVNTKTKTPVWLPKAMRSVSFIL